MVLKNEIEKAIIATCKRLQDNEDLTVQENLDALKSLAPFYTALSKGKKNTPDDEDNETFAKFADGINNAKGNGNDGHTEEIPSRRRRPGAN